MELHFDDFSLTLKAENFKVPYDLSDEPLFLAVRPYLIELLSGSETEIFHFGHAPDNTAEGQDELLENGLFFRIIGYEKNLGVDLQSAPQEVLSAFYYLVSNFEPKWTSIIIEQGIAKKEVTIELLYQEVF